MKQFPADELMNGYFDKASNTYDLEFVDGWIKSIPVDEHLEASTDPNYWDSQEAINKAAEQGEII